MTTPVNRRPVPAPPSDVHVEVRPYPPTPWLRRPRWQLSLAVQAPGGGVVTEQRTITGSEGYAVEVAQRWVDAYLRGTAEPPVRRVYGSGGPATGPTGSSGQARAR